MRAVPPTSNSTITNLASAFPNRGNRHKSCVSYSPVTARHHRGDILLNVRIIIRNGKKPAVNTVPGTLAVEWRVRPWHMQVGRKTVRTTMAQSPFQKSLKLPRAKPRTTPPETKVEENNPTLIIFTADDGPESDVKIVRAPNHRLHRIKEGVGGDLRVFLIQIVRN
jgi:hypothetical protein